VAAGRPAWGWANDDRAWMTLKYRVPVRLPEC
jgi:hypothetical protein